MSRFPKQSLNFGNICDQNPLKMAKSRSEKIRNYISNDLAFSVLSRLPLKSLKRFGCACKTWSLLFENPHFMKMFRTNFISYSHSYYNDTFLLLYQVVETSDYSNSCSFYLLSGKSYENRVKLDFPNPFHDENPFFGFLDVDMITGIFCLQKINTLVLWNPTTHESKNIPSSPAESVSPYREVEMLYHGFGYDPIRDDIKIIRFIHFCRISSRALQYLDVRQEDVQWNEISCEPLWELYSLRYNSWVELDFDIPICWSDSSSERLYKDGVCHWWFESQNCENFLVSYDLSHEEFITTAIPSYIHPDTDPNFIALRRQLVFLNGSIASILSYTGIFHISILGELGVKESWTKLFVIGPLPYIERVIGTGNNGDLFLKTKDREVVLFDLSIQIIEDINIKGGIFYDIAIYKENHNVVVGINH